jgi:hypothetical protein
MRTPILVTGLAMLFLSFTAQSQVVNWLTSFVPLWSNGNTNGNAFNISGTGLDLTSTVQISGGSFVKTNGSSGSNTPTVAGATYTVPGSSQRLQIATNFTSNSGYATIVLNYNGPITDASFLIADIDKPGWLNLSDFDRVTVTGSNGAVTVLPTITRYDNSSPDFLVISGNVAHVNGDWGTAGNSASNSSDQRGTVRVNFGSNIINRITIRFDNGPGVLFSPDVQSIAIGAVTFTPVAPLPVTLLSFAANRLNDGVQLKWITSQEINSDYFQIDRSIDGSSWDAIGQIAGAGNSGQLLSYFYTDRNFPTGTVFYRLKEVDLDGRFKYSSILRLSNDKIKNVLQTYPNPFDSQVNIELTIDKEQETILTIHDASSRQIYSAIHRLGKGNNNFMVPALGALKPGIYFLSLRDKEGNLVGQSRLIKK